MANRRMFSLDVVDTDTFLELPISSQALYFHLGMRADDDGFVSSPKRVTAMIGANQDDLKFLVVKGFIIVLEDGIIVIRHWKQNNYIQSDRHKKTIYQSQLAALTVNNGIYYEADTSCIQHVSKMDTQVSIGKVSIDKVSIGKVSIDKVSIDYQLIADMYNDTCVSYPRLTKLSDRRKKAIKARFNQGYSIQDFKRLFEMAEGSSFLKGSNNRNWSASFDWLITDANMIKVVLDDVGAQVENKEWISTALFRLIDSRYTEHLPTIYTSNVETLNLKTDSRVSERIYELSKPLPMPEVNIRHKIADRHTEKFLSNLLNDSDGEGIWDNP